MSRSSEFGTSILSRSAKEYILACLYTRARMTSPGKTNGTTTTHGCLSDRTRASPSPSQYRYRNSGQTWREDMSKASSADLEVGHTARRDARHSELDLFTKAERSLPFRAVSLGLCYTFFSQKPGHFAGDDIFRGRKLGRRMLPLLASFGGGRCSNPRLQTRSDSWGCQAGPLIQWLQGGLWG